MNADMSILHYFLMIHDVDMMGEPSRARAWGFMPFDGCSEDRMQASVDAGHVAQNALNPRLYYITLEGASVLNRDDIYIPSEFLEDESEQAK
jgi:hypothetical protein